MELILVRHGAHVEDRLSAHGQHQARSAARALARCSVKPSLYVSSTNPAAVATRDAIAAVLTPTAGIPTDVSHNLTQGSTSAGDLEGLLQELEGKSLELSFGDQVVLVGHEGRLSNLLTELTGQRDRPFEHGGLACVRAGSVAALRKGKAKVDFRFPVVDHGEKDLQAKAQSKMGVASFLAGFVFAALIEVLLNHPDTALHRAAAVMLTLALALFVAAIYIYDQLSMPPGFWTDGPRPRLPRMLAKRRERRIEKRWLKTAAQTTPEQADDETAAVRLDGPLFVTMVRASRWLFTPAVALSMLAFVAIVLGVHVWWVTAGAAISVAVAVVYFFAHRPMLGVD